MLLIMRRIYNQPGTFYFYKGPQLMHGFQQWPTSVMVGNKHNKSKMKTRNVWKVYLVMCMHLILSVFRIYYFN